MSPAIIGADPDELLQLAGELEHAQEALLTVKNQLGSRITSQLRWEGPDAFVFRHAWQSSYSPAIARTAAMLAETARMVRTQAAQQELASS